MWGSEPAVTMAHIPTFSLSLLSHSPFCAIRITQTPSGCCGCSVCVSESLSPLSKGTGKEWVSPFYCCQASEAVRPQRLALQLTSSIPFHNIHVALYQDQSFPQEQTTLQHTQRPSAWENPSQGGMASTLSSQLHRLWVVKSPRKLHVTYTGWLPGANSSACDSFSFCHPLGKQAKGL